MKTSEDLQACCKKNTNDIKKISSTALYCQKKTLRACLEDVIYSLVVPKNQQIKMSSTAFKKTRKAGKEELQPCCNEKHKGYQKDIRYPLQLCPAKQKKIKKLSC